MIRKQTKKLDNQGFSLLELLVAMALMGIITLLVGSLMTNGSIWYSGETAKADMQNDIQTINTKIQKTLMEATAISVSKDKASGVQYILTGEWDEDAKDWKSDTNPNGTARAIIVYKNKLYITDKYYSVAEVTKEPKCDISEGYLVSENLEEGTFDVTLNYTTDKTGKLDSLVTVDIEYGMVKNKKNSKSSYEVTLRNSSSFTVVEADESKSTIMLK